MEVDAAFKGKGKGKDKGKDKGKGKEKGQEKGAATTSASDTDKECLYCKGRGHIARNCKKRIADEKIKSG